MMTDPSHPEDDAVRDPGRPRSFTGPAPVLSGHADSSGSLAGTLIGVDGGVLRDSENREDRVRRISYFMLFRLVMLAGFTGLAALWEATLKPEHLDDAIVHGLPSTTQYRVLVWGTLLFGFAYTLVLARVLPRVRNLSGFAWGQTAADIGITVLVIHMSGGAASGFTFLFLVAILGAAIMGDRRQTWVAGALCAGLMTSQATLQLTGLIEPIMPWPGLELTRAELWGNVTRSLATMGAVTILSVYLNYLIATSASRVADLRALNENILRSLSSGVLTLDERGHLLYFNRAARHLLNTDPSALGLPLASILPEASREVLGEVGPGERIEFNLDRGGGSHHLSLSWTPLRDKAGNEVGRVVSFEDVTRLHELQSELARNERLAAIGRLAASVAHEVRNPLAAITGSAELLDADGQSPENERLLQIIRRESTRLNGLVTDLLAFTRPQPPQPRVVVLAHALREVVDSFSADPDNHRIRVELDAPANVVALIDPAQISQVLWNLLRNAAEAMNGQGTIQLRARAAGLRATIEVTDHGRGIDPDRVDRIFDPFYTTKERGTGFGLALVHRIVNDHGGSVALESQPGRGTTFALSLPAPR